MVNSKSIFQIDLFKKNYVKMIAILAGMAQ